MFYMITGEYYRNKFSTENYYKHEDFKGKNWSLPDPEFWIDKK